MLPPSLGGGGGAFILGPLPPLILPLLLPKLGGGGGRVLGIVGLTFLLDAGGGGGILKLGRSVNSFL